MSLAATPAHALGPVLRRKKRVPWWLRLRDIWYSPQLLQRTIAQSSMLAVVYAIFAFGGVYGWAYGGAYLLIFAVVGLWAAAWMSGRLAGRWHAIYLPLLLFHGWIAAQYIFGLTVSRGLTLSTWLHYSAGCALLFLLTQTLELRRDAPWMLPSCSLLCGAVAGLALAQYFTGIHRIYWVELYGYAVPAGPYVNRNHFAGCMELLLPLAIMQAIVVRRRGGVLTALWSLCPALGLAAMLMSVSRAGVSAVILETLIGLAVLAWALRHLRQKGGAASPPRPANSTALVCQPSLELAANQALATRASGALAHRTIVPRRKKRFRLRSRTGAALSIVVILVAFTAAIGTSSLRSRWSQLQSQRGDWDGRLTLTRGTLAMWHARPWAGWGLGTWSSVYTSYGRFQDTAVFYDYAHNDYVQLLAETGVVGGALLVLGLGLAVWEYQTASLSAPADSPAWLLGIGGLLGCAGLLFHSAFDFNLHIPANALLFCVSMALFVVRPHAEGRRKQQKTQEFMPAEA